MRIEGIPALRGCPLDLLGETVCLGHHRGTNQDGVPGRPNHLARLVVGELPDQLVKADRQLSRALVAVIEGVLGEAANVREEKGVEAGIHASMA